MGNEPIHTDTDRTNRTHLIVFPYWCQSELDRFGKLADSWTELTKTELKLEFLFLSRWDMSSSINIPVKFSPYGAVKMHKCVKPKFLTRGRPGKSVFAKHMFCQCMEFVEKNYVDDGGFVFWMEWDVVFARPDWLDTLDAEWTETSRNANPPLLLGHLVTDKNTRSKNRKDFVEHINGVACYSKSIVNYVNLRDSLGRGYSFDVYLSLQLKNLNLWGHVVISSVWDHRLDYECNSIRMDELSTGRNTRIVHGCKSDSNFNKFVKCSGHHKLGDYFLTHGVMTTSDTSMSWLEFIKKQGCEKYNIHVWETGGNFFFAGMANYMRKVFNKIGMVETTQSVYDSSVVDIVVAPHEFMYYDEGKNWNDDRVSSAIYVNTEQWNTKWFSKSLDLISKSKKAMDINPNSTKALQSLDIDAVFFPMIQLDQPDVNYDNQFSFQDRKFIDISSKNDETDFENREIDILYIGASNPRRDTALANMAKTLSSYDTFIHSPNLVGQPIFKDDPDAIDFKNVCKLARNSKVLLNIHRDEYPYFEWHRLFLMGINNGCVVLTESCLENNFLTAGTSRGHLNPNASYIESSLSAMPETIKFLFDTDAGKQRLRSVHEQAIKATQLLTENYFKM